MSPGLPPNGCNEASELRALGMFLSSVGRTHRNVAILLQDWSLLHIDQEQWLAEQLLSTPAIPGRPPTDRAMPEPALSNSPRSTKSRVSWKSCPHCACSWTIWRPPPLAWDLTTLDPLLTSLRTAAIDCSPLALLNLTGVAIGHIRTPVLEGRQLAGGNRLTLNRSQKQVLSQRAQSGRTTTAAITPPATHSSTRSRLRLCARAGLWPGGQPWCWRSCNHATTVKW